MSFVVRCIGDLLELARVDASNVGIVECSVPHRIDVAMGAAFAASAKCIEKFVVHVGSPESSACRERIRLRRLRAAAWLRPTSGAACALG